MTLAELIPIVLKVSVMMMIFAMGLGTRLADLADLMQQPLKLVRSLISMYGVMLVVAVAICKLTGPRPPVEIVIVVLSLASVPPLLPKKLVRADANTSYAVGLVVMASLFSVIWIPVAVHILQHVFDVPLSASTKQLASIALLNILAPLVGAALVRRAFPTLANRIERPLARAGSLLLLAVLLPLLYRLWHPMFEQIGGGTLIALATFIVVGLVSGHLLGGPSADDRTVLATASASRHPGISMALAHLNFPNEKSVVAVVLLYLVLSAILTLPYIAWRKRVEASLAIPSIKH